MGVKFYNTPNGKIEEFHSIQPNKAAIYSCGPTVYDYPHIGNWAAYVYWDILVRILIANGYEVARVMNMTDVGHLVSDADEGEDKLEKGARREGKTAWEVASFYADVFMAGMDRLNLIKPNYITKATEFIPEQIAMLDVLKEKNVTYTIDDGIYFDTSKFNHYADFAHLNLDELKAGARVEYNSQKRNPSDFALWKFTPSGEKRDMQWEYDGKMGFPGWHLECSAMALAKLGTTIDIHTGGIDHIPVHHSNEIAQSETANGTKFSNYWLHNNFITIDNTKISKSLGNTYTLDDIEKHGASLADFRMLLLQGHYRNSVNFTFDSLEAAKNRLHHWKNIAVLRHQMHDTTTSDRETESNEKTLSLYASIKILIDIISNDIDTPEALRFIDEAFDKIRSASLRQINHHSLVNFLGTVDELLGLELLKSTPDISEDQKRLIVERTRARENKDWKKSDKLRDTLEKQGIELLDHSGYSIWQNK